MILPITVKVDGPSTDSGGWTWNSGNESGSNGSSSNGHSEKVSLNGSKPSNMDSDAATNEEPNTEGKDVRKMPKIILGGRSPIIKDIKTLSERAMQQRSTNGGTRMTGMISKCMLFV